MRIIRKDLLDKEVPNSNPTIGYFPARTNVREEAFDWEIAKGVVIRNLYGKIVSSTLKVEEDEPLYNNFRALCKHAYEDKLDDPAMWEYIDSMYFSSEAFYKIAPECQLFKIFAGFKSSKNPLCDLFSSLMQDYHNPDPERIQRNFLEEVLVKKLRSNEVLVDFSGSRLSKGIDEEAYLPFLSDLFCKDIQLLSDYPKYLIQNLEEFLKLYGYLYTAQLALNINGWKDGEPKVRPVYFILENETASVERTDLTRNGHQNVAKSLGLIFPYLTMSEAIQNIDEQKVRKPLWKMRGLVTTEDADGLRKYAEAFAEQRDISLESDLSNTDEIYWLEELLKLSVRQFERGTSRASAHGKFIKSTENELCSTFVRNRGRVGKILVMNQDYLSILTNLAIGENDRLRFQDLLVEFTKRGVNFDKRSQQALIKFYDRVGNVERMSDSGDAVYVRKTV